MAAVDEVERAVLLQLGEGRGDEVVGGKRTADLVVNAGGELLELVPLPSSVGGMPAARPRHGARHRGPGRAHRQ
jgi:hypothetical protein